ncbi:MAG: hypothetical protein WCG02_02260 [Candidatus Taylorbacteria bacterium]
MNTPKTSKKTIIIIAAIIIVAIIGYFYYMGGQTVSSSTLEISKDTTDAQVAGQRVLGLLNQIRQLRIDTKLFEDPMYRTLMDYTVDVPPQEVGRLNPFAPIPGMPVAGTVKK